MKIKNVKIDFINGKSVEEITLTNNFMLRAYERYLNTNFEDYKKINTLVKYFLPQDFDKAMSILKDGIDFNNKHYVAFLTSPSLMKQEENKKKTQYFFILEEHKEFIDVYSKLITLGLDYKLFSKDDIVINKDIIARYSLGLSGSYKIEYKPNVIILPSDSYNFIADYVTINAEGKLEDVSKEVVQAKEHEFADGCGFISPKLCDVIKEQMQLDYDVDFAVIRFTMATKGLVVKADFNRYYNDTYVTDTEYFEKREDGYYVKDYFENWVNLSKADLILNTNMVKYAKLFKDEEFKDINSFINDKIDKEFKNYKDLLQALYVTKVNKEPKKLKDYTQINYQILNNLALLPHELEQIQSQSEGYLNRVSAMEEDAVKLFMGDIAREEEREISASTKVHKLIQLEEFNFIKTGNAKRVINNLLLKKAHEVVCNPYVKGNYKVAFIDPICYLNWIMTRDIPSSRELGVREYYVAREVGKRVITRNPLAVFSEIHKINLTTTDKLEKYFGDLTSEIFFMNMADDTSFVSSGSDCDGDIFGVWDNELLYNAVIEPRDNKHFFNTLDGASVSVNYSKQKEYECILKGSGNLIGSIANVTTKISNMCNTINYKYDGSILSYMQLREMYIDSNAISSSKRLQAIQDELEQLEGTLEDERKEVLYKAKDTINKEIKAGFEASLEQLIKEGIVVDLIEATESEQRESIIEQFYNAREIAYKALQLSQIAIDSPKTLYLPSEDELEIIRPFKEMKYPRFMYYSKYTRNYDSIKVKYEDTNYSRSALNINASRVQRELITPINENKKSNDNPFSYIKLLEEIALEDAEAEQYITWLLEAYRQDKRVCSCKLDYNLLDEKYIVFAESIENKFGFNKAAGALINNKATTEFITKYFWNTIEFAINSKDRKVSIYVKDESGSINYLFNNYTKEEATLREGRLQENFKKDINNRLYATFKVYCLDDTLLEVKEGQVVQVKLEDYKGNKKLNSYLYLDDAKLGYIFGDINTKALKIKDLTTTSKKYLDLRVYKEIQD